MLGARAAMINRGDYTTAVERLTVGASVCPEAAADLKELQANVIGKVSLKGRKKLTPEKTPFVPEHRLAIEHAQQVLSETGSFDGWLPKGTYKFGKSKVVAS